MENKLDGLYMGIAILHSKISKARRAKVGCCIVTPQLTILGGVNGTPSGFDNNCETEKEDGTLVTRDCVVHAEKNAIAAAARTGVSLMGACAYVTLSPCVPCAVLMKQVGITRVVYKDIYRDTSGLDTLRALNIEVQELNHERSN